MQTIIKVTFSRPFHTVCPYRTNLYNLKLNNVIQLIKQATYIQWRLTDLSAKQGNCKIIYHLEVN